MLILLSRYFIIQKELDNSFYIIIPFVHYMPYNVSQNEIDITMCLRYVLKSKNFNRLPVKIRQV